jgi:hypothetical protein
MLQSTSCSRTCSQLLSQRYNTVREIRDLDSPSLSGSKESGTMDKVLQLGESNIEITLDRNIRTRVSSLHDASHRNSR